MADMDLDPAVRAYYEKGKEASRLIGERYGPLERTRTEEIILRYLPSRALDILDVGGGPGVYAVWLAEQGHRVHVVDPISLHVEQAGVAHPDVSAELGDARQLRQHSASMDAVLMLGPLYHLVEREDRLTALREARRVLRSGGLLFAAAISRFAALLDLLVNLDRLHEPDVYAIVEHSVKTGAFRGPGEAGLFTTSYFHLPSELAVEVAEAGFEEPEVFSIEGPGFLVPNFEERWSDPQRRDAMLRAAQLVEEEPEMLGAASHLLVVARESG
jgi:ubiquinone/menaquinone biosynthesis C-methylase UbiE